jgi:hypothetical protein
LDIDDQEKDASEISSLFIDSSSFDSQDSTSPSVIPAPGDVATKFKSMIDRPPTRANLRTVELTMFLLRSIPKREETAALLTTPSTTDEMLAKAFSETAWSDLLHVLRAAHADAWSRLMTCTLALSAIGDKARDDRSRLTRFDFELFASAVSSEGLGFIITSTQSPTGFSDLGAKLLAWLTEPREREARIAAAEVFKAAWKVAGVRFSLAQLPEGYFDALPALEAISNAVKHELGKKFYRDHLSHNVRAALLAAHLVAHYPSPDKLGGTSSLVGFFAGLFHDLALPVTAFPDTIGGIATALSQAQKPGLQPASSRGLPAIIDRSELKKSLSYVAMLASVKNLPEALLTESFRPWEGTAKVLDLVDGEILLEEMLCATSDEHALVSSALMFDYAVRGIGSTAGYDFDTGVRSLLSNLTGSAATASGREFASILQAMALHDRRAAAEHHGVTEPPVGTPKALYFGGFALPALVSIADELQEWGRTIGKLNEVGATDAHISIERPEIRTEFQLSESAEIFAEVPFSMLEYCIGKLRTIGRFKWEDGRSLDLRLTLSHLTAFEARYLLSGPDFRIHFIGPFEQLSLGADDHHEERRETVAGLRGMEVIALGATGTLRKRDILLVRGGEAELTRLRQRCQVGLTLKTLSVSRGHFALTFACGYELSGKPGVYYFGEVGDTSTPTDRLPIRQRAAVIEISDAVDNAQLIGSDLKNEAEPQGQPYGHFLDFDWRFTARTCRALVQFAHERAVETRREICYLGCPSLALWHQKIFPDDKNWLLLDRGHFAVDRWLNAADIPKARFKTYNVFDTPAATFRRRFGLVLTDPPWYDPHYETFCRRADALLAPGGILGVTYYPRSLDESKFERFQAIVFRGAIRYLRPFGAVEIDYLAPEFEKPTDIYRRYEHPSLGIYRPGFMDFYLAPSDRNEPEDDQAVAREGNTGFEDRIEMSHGHHILTRSEAELSSLLPAFVKPVRRGIKRLRQVSGNYVAWTTRNLVLKVSPETTAWRVDSAKDLAATAQAVEDSGEPLVFEGDE